MSTVLPFRSRRRRREEAAHWILSIEEGLTKEEELQMKEWLQADPRNPASLIEMARPWDRLNLLSDLSGIFPLTELAPDARSGRPARVASMAALVAVLGISVWFGHAAYDAAFGPGDPAAGADTGTLPRVVLVDQGLSDQSSLQRFATGVGERFTAKLSDGSLVTLNTNTTVEVRYAHNERRIYLRSGEATFNVAHDAGRPFRVDTGERIFQALGTVFNVDRHGGAVELTVTEGRVAVSRATGADRGAVVVPSMDEVDVTVLAGQQVVIADGEESLRRLTSLEIDSRLAWQKGVLVFHGERLVEVLAEVERYAPVKLRLADPKLEDIKVGGYFRTGDIDGVLLVLRENFGIESARNENGDVELRRASSGTAPKSTP